MISFAIVHAKGAVYCREPNGRWTIMPEGSIFWQSSTQVPTQQHGYFADTVEQALAMALESELQQRVREGNR